MSFRSPILNMIYRLVGYLYLRIRYGNNHRHILTEKYNGDHVNAGMEAIWMPILTVAIIVLLWALIWIGIGAIRGM